MRSSLVSLEFRRRRESLFGNIKNEKVSASMARMPGRGKSPPRSPQSCHHLATNSSLRILSHSLRYISTASGRASPLRAPTSLAPPRTRTHAHAHRSHAHRPDTGGFPRASSPIRIFPCSGFSFNVQVFPWGRGRGGEGADIMGEI